MMKILLFFLLLFPVMLNAQPSEELILTGKVEPSVFNEVWAKIWNQDRINYKPDPISIEKLKVLSKEYHIKVIFGTWCEDSEHLIPPFLKVAELSNLHFELTAVNREKHCPYEDCNGWDITNIPTFIVLKGDKEIGRIVESVQKSMEADLVALMEHH